MPSRYSVVALVFGLLFGSPVAAFDRTPEPVAGTWALERDVPDKAYVLASSGLVGTFLICFDAGNVRTVTVAVGDESSVLVRGSCTLFAPTEENGIVVGFADPARAPAEQPVALGSFRVVTDERP